MVRFAILPAMKNTIRALAVFAALLPALAAAQVPNTPQTLPANTVVGRLGVTAGPAQAIPFARFQSAISGPCATATPGLVPATGGGTANFLRADCTFAPPLPTVGANRIVANATGATAQATGATPTSIWDSFCSTTIGNIWVRLSSGWGCLSLGYANPEWWGADPTGVADSASAINSALATNLPVRLSPGAYKSNSKITFTPATAFGCFCFSGSGVGVTSINWPNASGGLEITGTTTGGSGLSYNVVKITDIKLTTSRAAGGSGLVMANGGTVNAPASIISNVVIQGDDYAQGAGSHYWTIGYYNHNWPHVNIYDTTINSKWINPLTSAVGTGMQIEGDVGTTSYTQSIKVTNSNIGYMAQSVVLGDYWQGILFDQTNFSGNQCILQAGGAAGTLVQLVVSNSIFYCDFDAIEMNTSVIQLQLYNNNVIIINTSAPGAFVLGTSTRAIATGNAIVGPGIGTGGNGISYSGSYGLFIGNQFSSMTTGISLPAASSQTVAALNIYFSTTNKIANAGVNNSPGTQAVGNMAGVVP